MKAHTLPFWMSVAATLFLSASTATAQTASMRGTVVDAATGDAIAGATVRIARLNDVRTVAGAITNANGRFHIEGIAAGSYSIEYSSIGFASHRLDSVYIASGERSASIIQLEEKAVGLGSVIISASRKSERALDAPASVWTANRRRIEQTAALTPVDHLRGVAGVDLAQKGVMQTEVVARGHGNVFSGSLLTLADGRSAGVPSLRANIPYLIPIVNDDIERIELVRGPGSALFGPNAANGVLNIVTRSPFASQGTNIQMTGGTNDLFHGEVRHADVVGERFGYKISGQYLRALDWPFADTVEISARAAAIAGGANADTLRVGRRDPVSERFGGEARLDYLVGDDASVNLAGGFTQAARAVDLTSLGAAQARDWRYWYLSVRADIAKLTLQGFFNASDAGETYLLRSGNRIVDRSQQIGARAQHSAVIDGVSDLTYGADLTLTRPRTDSTITGRNETSDDINEVGAYLQSESRLFDDNLSLVFAGRIDYHNRIADLVFSPRAAVAYRPADGQQVRLTFNQAYSTPSTNDLFLDLQASANPFGFPDPYAIALRVSGMPLSGYRFRRDDGGLYFRSPFARGSDIPVSASASLWSAVSAMVAGGVAADTTIPQPQRDLITMLLDRIEKPGPTSIASRLALLNLETGSFDPTASVEDAAALEPTFTRTIEAGYKGLIGDDIELSVDLYWSRISNFIGAAEVFTPNVFLDADATAAFLLPAFEAELIEMGFDATAAAATAAALAPMLGTGFASVPLGTVTPEGVSDSTAVLMVPRNYGVVNVGGVDVSADVRVSSALAFGATLSMTDDAVFGKSDDVPMNAPSFKASVSSRYRHEGIGLRADARFRYSSRFDMASGVFRGEVPAYGLLDISIGYRLPWLSTAELLVSATNVLGNRHQEFIGAPEIGRLITARLSYRF